MSTWKPISTAPHGEIDIKLHCGSILCGALLQSDGDFWWCGHETGEIWINRSSVAEWREPDKGPGQEEGEVRWMVSSYDGSFPFIEAWHTRDDADFEREQRGDIYRVVRVRIVRKEE